MSRLACRSKQALLSGLRPNPSSPQKVQCGVCPNRCIYCDIWKLATLFASHVPLSASTKAKLQRRTSDSPTSPRDSFDWERNERLIEAQFQTQRARLASILSICTVEGADECEGLRIAHDRCFGSVTELMMQERMQERMKERMLEQRMLEQRCICQSSSSGNQRRTSKNCGEIRGYYQDERRTSMVGMAN